MLLELLHGIPDFVDHIESIFKSSIREHKSIDCVCSSVGSRCSCEGVAEVDLGVLDLGMATQDNKAQYSDEYECENFNCSDAVG